MSTTISTWLQRAQAELKISGISTARLDCLVLLEDETGKDRAWLLSHPEFELQGSVLKNLSTKIAQRAKHVPLAYIRGKAEFYGRMFAVNAHTLVPRPETETMIDLLKSIVIPAPEPESRNKKWIPDQVRDDSEITIMDVGTGSGAIAITAKRELPKAEVFATDIDKKCLETARANAKKLGTDVEFLHGNLLDPLFQIPNSKFQILLCNLPYVPDNFQINRAATHEPRHALFGGPDGLDLYREMFKQIETNPWKPQFVLTESLPPQHETLTEVAQMAGYHLQETDDFIQVFRSL